MRLIQQKLTELRIFLAVNMYVLAHNWEYFDFNRLYVSESLHRTLFWKPFSRWISQFNLEPDRSKTNGDTVYQSLASTKGLIF